MLSKSKIKLIRSLELKKFREETGYFLAEGNKLVADLLPFFECELLVTRASWLATQGDIEAKELLIADEGDIERVSLLKTPQDVLAVFRQPIFKLEIDGLKNKLSLILDGIQDPGNLGTIIRIADWYGIQDIICSRNTADVFNPKVIQATMGALARVCVHYVDLVNFLSQLKDVPVYGTFLDGEDIYKKTLTSSGLIIMGSEGQGISESLEPLITDRLYLPNYPNDQETSESLNVAVATAITCAEFRRRLILTTN